MCNNRRRLDIARLIFSKTFAALLGFSKFRGAKHKKLICFATHSLRSPDIDDTFVVIKKTYMTSFYKFIDNIEDNIEFKVEHKVDNAIPLLDVLIICHVNSGQLTTKAYKNPYIPHTI